MRKTRYKIFTIIAIVLVAGGVLLFTDYALAADGSQVLATVTNKFKMAASAWGDILLNYAKALFWGLGVISLVYTTGEQFLKGLDIQQYFAHLIKFIMFFGFFLFLLENGPWIARTLINSMMKLGSHATGAGIATGSDFMDTAFEIYDKIALAADDADLFTGLLLGLFSIILLLIFAIIAANLTIEYCAAWILLYGGVFFLGFGATRWTSDMALNYFKAILSSGVRIFGMLLIIGAAGSIATETSADMAKGPITLEACSVLLVTGMILLALMNKVPSMLAGMVGGGLAAGSMGVGTMMAAAGGAAAIGSFIGSGGLGGLAAKCSAAKDAISKAFRGASGSGGGSGSGSGSIYSGGSAARAAGGAFASAVGGESRYAAPASGGGNGSSGYSGSFSGGGQGESQSSTSASSDGVMESPESGSSGTPPISSGDAPAYPGTPSSPSGSGASQPPGSPVSGSSPSSTAQSGGATTAGAVASTAGAAFSGGSSPVSNTAQGGVATSAGVAASAAGAGSPVSGAGPSQSAAQSGGATSIGSSTDIGETGGIGDTGPSHPNAPETTPADNQNQNAAPADNRRKTTVDYLGQATRDLAQDLEK